MKTTKEQLQDKLFRRKKKFTHLICDLNDYIALSAMPSDVFSKQRLEMRVSNVSQEDFERHYHENIKVIACPQFDDKHPDAVIINEYYIKWFRELALFLNNDFTPDALGYVLGTIEYLKVNIDKLD